MSNKYDYPQVNEVGEVTNDDASLEIVEAPGEGLYLFIERLNISVYEPGQSGAMLRIQDTNGESKYTINAEGVKDISLDFGDEGYRLDANVGLQVVAYGSQGEQASVSVALSGHLSFQG